MKKKKTNVTSALSAASQPPANPLDSENWASESSLRSMNVSGDSSGSPLEITTDSLPDGTVGVEYAAGVAATGGTPGYYQWSADSLPPGLAITGSSVIVGIPTASGTYPFTVTLLDSANPPNEASKDLTIVIGEL